MSNERVTPPSGSGKPKEAASKLPSSAGNSPRVMTPHDVQPDQAAWRDRTERKISATDEETRIDALLDEANDLSFPASDPIAIPSSTSESDKVKEKKSDRKK